MMDVKLITMNDGCETQYVLVPDRRFANVRGQTRKTSVQRARSIIKRGGLIGKVKLIRALKSAVTNPIIPTTSADHFFALDSAPSRAAHWHHFALGSAAGPAKPMFAETCLPRCQAAARQIS
jgi:hypothetical protein